MKIKYTLILLIILCSSTTCSNDVRKTAEYTKYHAEITLVEELISQEKYEEALNKYDSLFSEYDFIFLRDLKVAAQISLLVAEKERGLNYIYRAIKDGWELSSLKSQKFLLNNLLDSDWGAIERQYEFLRDKYLNRIDTVLRSKVYSMMEKDQFFAYEAYIIEDEEEQKDFISENFPELSEEQLFDLIEIIETYGYPGEFLIGNDVWVSTILSHHNSQGLDYVRKDTLYDFIRPKLIQFLDKGYISPYEIALPEDWRKTLLSDGRESAYAYLIAPNMTNISQINRRRKAIGLRSVELRNRLVEIELKTGMSFYLPDWVDGEIVIEGKQ